MEKTQAWNQRDLIKALTACRAVTRSWGQPEKVVTYLFPHLTYRPVPAWHVVSGTARGNCTAPTMAPFPLTARELQSSPEAVIRAPVQLQGQSSDPTTDIKTPLPCLWPWPWGGRGDRRKLAPLKHKDPSCIPRANPMEGWERHKTQW